MYFAAKSKYMVLGSRFIVGTLSVTVTIVTVIIMFIHQTIHPSFIHPSILLVIVGAGVSAGAVIFGEIARTSTKKARTSAFSFFMASRQVGLVIGPGLNLFLRKFNTHLGPYIVDKYRSPAVS